MGILNDYIKVCGKNDTVMTLTLSLTALGGWQVIYHEISGFTQNLIRLRQGVGVGNGKFIPHICRDVWNIWPESMSIAGLPTTPTNPNVSQPQGRKPKPGKSFQERGRKTPANNPQKDNEITRTLTFVKAEDQKRFVDQLKVDVDVRKFLY